jgi:RNA-binding protein 26
VVPGPMFPMNGPSIAGHLPFMPMFTNGGVPFGMGSATYDPNEARMDIGPPGGRQPQRAPIIPRIPQANSEVVPIISGPGELPVIQDLTPEVPPDSVSTHNSLPPMHHVDHISMQRSNSDSAPKDVEMAPPTMSPSNFRGDMRTSKSQMGTFSADAHDVRPERRNGKTLVVEKIPDEKLSLEAVNEWFKKFGTVTNVAVDAKNKKALVSFADHSAAHAAWKSEDAVFNNRFVKVFWHRPMQGHGKVGAKLLAASAPVVANMGSKVSTASDISSTASLSQNQSPSSSSAQPKKPAKPPVTASVLAERIERQITEQKSLMASLSSASSEEKKLIMGKLRKLREEMESGASFTKESSLDSNNRSESKPRPGAHEQSMRERLDKELELHSATATVEANQGDSTEDLKATLAELKAEVHNSPRALVSDFADNFNI